MRVDSGRQEDISHWLDLAAEVEPLFGPMVADREFHRALWKHIQRGTAFCVREDDGPPGSPLIGGLLFSPKPPRYEIGWLAVASKWRRRGVGRRLIEHAFGLVQPPAEMMVTTFGSDVQAGQPARRFYEQMGSEPAEPAPPSPAGESRQVYRRVLRSKDTRLDAVEIQGEDESRTRH